MQFDDNGIWMNKAELEQIIHNDLMHRQNQYNSLKPSKKDEYQKSTASAASSPNSIPSPNNHDQLNAVYDI